MGLHLRFAARSEVGLVRPLNEDSGYADSHLLIVADGMGGHAAGEVASATAIEVVKLLADQPSGAAEPPASGSELARDPEIGGLRDDIGLDVSSEAGAGFGTTAVLRDAVSRAGARFREMIAADPGLEGMGTTLTILLQSDHSVAIAQVGDSRAYLLRNGVLEQLTHDQTFVQTLVDEGRISSEAAMLHPQRSLLLQALDGRADVEPVIEIRTPVAGDRYLVCSDGLSAVVSEATVRDVLSTGSADEASDQLVQLALRGGAPDNVTCLVADLVGDDEPSTGPAEIVAAPTMVGAAAEAAARATAAGTGRLDRRRKRRDPDDPDRGGEGSRIWRLRVVLPIVIFLGLVVVGVFGGYRWTQSQYYVGIDHGGVAIYRGVPQRVAGHALSSVVTPSGIPATALPSFAHDQVSATIPAANLADAHRIVQNLRQEAQTCMQIPEGPGCPPGVATPTPGPTQAVSPGSAPTARSTTSPTTPVSNPATGHASPTPSVP
jgi:PPM family protein phosphatase